MEMCHWICLLSVLELQITEIKQFLFQCILFLQLIMVSATDKPHPTPPKGYKGHVANNCFIHYVELITLPFRIFIQGNPCSFLYHSFAIMTEKRKLTEGHKMYEQTKNTSIASNYLS